jgi:glucokinase
MTYSVGILAAEHVAAGRVEGNRLAGPLLHYPAGAGNQTPIQEMPGEIICQRLAELVHQASQEQPVQVVGLGFPGIIRSGLVEESPNLQQVKGVNLQAGLEAQLRELGFSVPVHIFNDADVMAAGVAATRNHLDRLIRVWTLGDGIGFGRYPSSQGIWEGGHIVVTLDPREHFCGCGGTGHLEGIMGHRAMRLRFLDLEPEEVFEYAKSGDARCASFVDLWHRALAAGTATSIHFEGPGKFFISGPRAQHLELGLFNRYLNEMVKMSPLQGSHFEIIPTSDEIGVIGAAVNAGQVTPGQAHRSFH